MKTVFIFIGLKLAEIAGAVLALWILGEVSFFIVDFAGFPFRANEHYLYERFMSFLIICLFLVFSVILFVGCHEWFSANWKKAKQIGGKW